MPVVYAVTRVDEDAPYAIYGKGEDAAQALADAAARIGSDDADAPSLRRNLTAMTPADVVDAGIAMPGQPVIWHNDLRHFVVEDHGAPASGTHPTGITSR